MSEAHFGLQQLPFTLTPHTGFYYGLPPHEEALQVLRVALAGGEGFIKVTGEVGTGKTLLLRKLMAELADTCQVIYLPNPWLSPEELRLALAHELGLETGSQSDFWKELATALQQLVGSGQGRAVIVNPQASLVTARGSPGGFVAG